MGTSIPRRLDLRHARSARRTSTCAIPGRRPGNLIDRRRPAGDRATPSPSQAFAEDVISDLERDTVDFVPTTTRPRKNRRSRARSRTCSERLVGHRRENGDNIPHSLRGHRRVIWVIRAGSAASRSGRHGGEADEGREAPGVDEEGRRPRLPTGEATSSAGQASRRHTGRAAAPS